VSSTILMAIVLVVMWLVVLVPMFVRRHDDRLESRSMDRFQTAMRVLSRRTPGSGGVAVRRRYGTPPPGRSAGGAPPAGSAARAQMLSRRRRTLAVLATTALLAVPAALLITSWMWLLQVPTLLLLVGYLGWLRQQVRREEERRTRRSALFGERPYGAAAAGTRGAASRTRSTRPTRRTAAAATDSPVDSSQADGDPSWRPVPVPTPTYVTAPVARRRRESLVELDDEDLWFADVDLLGDAVDRPRAVNE
jgi:hypothetical protein